MFSFEDVVWKNNELAIGLDEVGRGAFAGPLGVGGVVFNKNIKNFFRNSNVIVRDSKKMTELQREKASNWIIENCIYSHVEFISVKFIDNNGLTSATQLGFRNAVNVILKRHAELVSISRSQIGVRDDRASVIPAKAGIQKLLLDAFELKNHDFFTLDKQEAIVKGDSKSFSIAAASIIAKVTRDNLMKNLAKNTNNKKYFWNKNKGYGTLEHRNAISKFGDNEHHRRLFIK